jgi:hypothetical protein
MAQDEEVDPTVPRRDAPIELDEEPVGIGTAVHEQPTAAVPLEEDRVALTDVEDRHRGHACRPARGDGAGAHESDDDRGRGQPRHTAMRRGANGPGRGGTGRSPGRWHGSGR